MHVSDKMIYLFLLLVCLSLAGMISQSWRLILYPYLFVIGLTILLGMWKSIKKTPIKIWIPVLVSITYLILYGWLDVLAAGPFSDGADYIFGMTPTMALYMLIILPCSVIVCLLYAITFTDDKNPVSEVNK